MKTAAFYVPTTFGLKKIGGYEEGEVHFGLVFGPKYNLSSLRKRTQGRATQRCADVAGQQSESPGNSGAIGAHFNQLRRTQVSVDLADRARGPALTLTETRR